VGRRARMDADGDDNDPAVLARQWLAVRQYHQKVKNRVDTKASKGRKIRCVPAHTAHKRASIHTDRDRQTDRQTEESKRLQCHT
jgi:hypothetical protein